MSSSVPLKFGVVVKCRPQLCQRLMPLKDCVRYEASDSLAVGNCLASSS